MTRTRRSDRALAGVFLAFLVGGTILARAGGPEPKALPVEPSRGFWVKNAGQLPREVLFTAEIPGGRLVVREHDLVVQLVEAPPAGESGPGGFGLPGPDRCPEGGGEPRPSRRVSNFYLRFPGGRFGEVLGEEPAETKIHIFAGRDPKGWHTDITTVRSVRVKDLYPGLDLVLDARNRYGSPWYLEQKSDTSDLGAVRLAVDTRARTEWLDEGVRLSDAFAALTLPPPALVRGGQAVARVRLGDGGSRLLAPGSPAAARRSRPGESYSLGLLWGTYLGGSTWDRCYALALDPSGDVVVGGESDSLDIPVPGGYQTTMKGVNDIYVAKLSASGDALLWGTHLGGSDIDSAYSLVLDASGNMIVGGWTNSLDIPVPGGYQTVPGPLPSYDDMYIAKLSSSGNALLWGTYLGGRDYDRSNAVALDASENVIVGGQTQSTDMPAPGGFQGTNRGQEDIYVAKLSASGNALLWATYLGGSSDEGCNALAVDKSDASDDVVVGGYTYSNDIPVPRGYQGALAGPVDIYIARLSASGNALLWGTYLGGTGYEGCESVALDPSGNVVVGGGTTSADIPVPGGTQTIFGGGFSDMYLAKLSPSGDALLWGTYLGGSSNESCTTLTLDASGDLVLGGYTTSDDIPTPGGTQTSGQGGQDIFVAKLSVSGRDLLWGTHLGGSADDECLSLAAKASGDVVVGGVTQSADIPAPGGFHATHHGSRDIYVATLCLLPSIETPPHGQTIPIDASVTLSVTATGKPPLAYRWCEGAEGDLSTPVGTDSPEFTTPPLKKTTSYWVRVSNDCGKADSPAATITVCEPPSITTQPRSQSVPLGQAVTLTVEAAGPTAPAYQWYQGAAGDTTSPVGTGAPAFTTPPLTATTAYWVRVGGDCASVDSATATVTVCTLTCSAGASPASGSAPLAVSFSASAGIAGGCPGEIAFSWDFGDGGASGLQNPGHTYTAHGTFTWSVTATAIGLSCFRTGTVTVHPSGGLPGDCNGDGSVSIGETQKVVNMYLGVLAAGCGADCNGSGSVSIGEVQKVVNAFLGVVAAC